MGWQWSSGTSRPGWNREAGPVPVPAVKRKPNVSCLVRSRYATNARVPEPGRPGEKMLQADYERPRADTGKRVTARRTSTHGGSLCQESMVGWPVDLL